MFKFFKSFLDFNSREIARLKLSVAKINELGPTMAALTDDEMRVYTTKLQTKVQKEGVKLDDVLPEAFALVREASHRTLGQKHFDTQLIAGIALHEGRIAEQKTGEGKTLTATLALYLNALTGKGVHLVTVNDYLARRDAGWMGQIFHHLGLTTSAIISEASFMFDPTYEGGGSIDGRLSKLRPISRKEAYAADVTYGINSEFGFDYLRDNMAEDPSQLAQRGFHYAIVDEADSVLIDEARTPHIISAPVERDISRYYEYAKLVRHLVPATDFVIDEKQRTVNLTDAGVSHIETMIGVSNLYEKDYETLFYIEAALKAETLFRIDKDYIVKEGEVVIVDEFTGRLLEGRRFSEGLHQAIEAKENVAIKKESRTLATVSLQNYFRMYVKLAGMTGTAATETEEFNKIYKTDVLIVPTHRPIGRKDLPDMIYKTEKGKYIAVADEIARQHESGRPVLVGTTSIEKNELLSSLLKKRNS
jgi:preprotein translocase subunit SecA